ncbi:MAG: DUF2461 domain-containing protein [Anaerolineales bacterium]|nr:DUF2461 domain-containing protein [Anaerolineales bacterium]MCB8951974.1 DUF2461 domain-containing protein [Ardenticatenales bacterium]
MFNGFSTAGLQFLTDLIENNNREWFNERKDIYQDEIVTPALAFIGDLGERLKQIAPGLRSDMRTNGSGSLMRIYRDTRFSKDKSPYKTNVGIVFWEGSGKKMELPGFYFHLSAEEAWIGGGLYMLPQQSMDTFRQAVADEEGGAALQRIIGTLSAAGYRLHGDTYKRVPAEFAPDHPRADLLRFKGIFAGSPNIPMQVVCSPRLVDVCFEHCRQTAPLHQWFVRHVTGN